MAKSTVPARIAVETKIGRIVFRAKPNGSFVVRTKGRDRIRIYPVGDAWEATTAGKNDGDMHFVTSATSPEQAYKRAIKSFWA